MTGRIIYSLNMIGVIPYIVSHIYLLYISGFFPMNKICSGRYLCDYICSIQTT